MALTKCFYLPSLQKKHSWAKMRAKKGHIEIHSPEKVVIPDEACSWLTHHFDCYGRNLKTTSKRHSTHIRSHLWKSKIVKLYESHQHELGECQQDTARDKGLAYLLIDMSLNSTVSQMPERKRKMKNILLYLKESSNVVFLPGKKR